MVEFRDRATADPPIDRQRDALLAPSRGSAGSHAVAFLLAASAGCLDGFTFIGHGRVFASAMTGNLVLFGIHLADPDRQLASYAVPMLAFVVGVIIADRAMRGPVGGWLWNRPHGVILVSQIVTLVVLASVPLRLDDRVLVAIITLGTAMQNASFRTVGRSRYNSVFMTGNLQSLAGNVDKGAFGEARDIGVVILGFVAGAALGALLTPHLGNPTLLAPAMLLTMAAIVLLFGRDAG